MVGFLASALPVCLTAPLVASSSLGHVLLPRGVSDDGVQEGARSGGFSPQSHHCPPVWEVHRPRSGTMVPMIFAVASVPLLSHRTVPWCASSNKAQATLQRL